VIAQPRQVTHEIFRTSAATIDTAIALAASALVLFILANVYPLIALKVNGATRVATLTGAALGLYLQGYATMAVLVVFTAILVPLAQILAFLYALVPLRLSRPAPGQALVFRLLAALKPWAMAEVFILAALVAMVKLASQAEVAPRIALGAYALLMFALTALSSITPTEQFWQWIERTRA
jgi:paraquat-inducible protein A